MLKWKIFNRSKEKKEISTKIEMKSKNVEEYHENLKIFETSKKSEEIPIKEFNETLYSSSFIQKKPVITHQEKKEPLKRSNWENLETIEHNVDEIKDKRTEVTGTIRQTSDEINQKVDHILYKKNFR